ncbi:hypothetical protein CPC08DRAFT_761993 [Agrocybe pediades]|nr:hypothetical protein CPC08DRAFT_761993 [Agrocybe pediades]
MVPHITLLSSVSILLLATLVSSTPLSATESSPSTTKQPTTPHPLHLGPGPKSYPLTCGCTSPSGCPGQCIFTPPSGLHPTSLGLNSSHTEEENDGEEANEGKGKKKPIKQVAACSNYCGTGTVIACAGCGGNPKFNGCIIDFDTGACTSAF